MVRANLQRYASHIEIDLKDINSNRILISHYDIGLPFIFPHNNN